MAEEIHGSAANVTHALHNIDFPCGKQDLVRQAEKNNAEQDVVQILRKLPDQQYTNMAEVMKGFGKEKQ